MHITDYQKMKDLTELCLFIFDAGDDIGTRTIFAKDLGKALLKYADASDLAASFNLQDLPKPDSISANDRFLLGQADGKNKAVAISDYFDILDPFVDVAFRRTHFRGKNLGSVYTEEQKAAVRDGSFRGFFVGDYWEIGDKKYRIVDFDFYVVKNTTYGTNIHHLLIMPDNCFGTIQIHTNNVAKVWYNNTTWRSYDTYINRGACINIVKADFGESSYFEFKGFGTTAATDDGVPSAHGEISNWGLELPSVINYAGFTRLLINNNSYYNVGIHDEQYALFKIRPDMMASDQHVWTRDKYGSNQFVIFTSSLLENTWICTNVEGGIRPSFPIKG